MTIKLKIKGRDVEMTSEEARQLHEQLLSVFGIPVMSPPMLVPYIIPQGIPQPNISPPQPQWGDPPFWDASRIICGSGGGNPQPPHNTLMCYSGGGDAWQRN